MKYHLRKMKSSVPYVPTVLVFTSPNDPSVRIPWLCLAHRYFLLTSMLEFPFKSGGGEE